MAYVIIALLVVALVWALKTALKYYISLLATLWLMEEKFPGWACSNEEMERATECVVKRLLHVRPDNFGNNQFGDFC